MKKTEHIYTIVPANGKGFNVYLSTEELYGIKPIAWFATMKEAEKYCEFRISTDSWMKEIKNHKNKKTQSIGF